MKKSVALKTLAILLCAASLFGILGSAVGLFLAGEFGLNHSSTEEYAAQQKQLIAAQMAQNLAEQYASEHLGHFTPELMDCFYIPMQFYSRGDTNKMGYAILDEHNQLLAGYQVEKKDSSGTVLRFQPSGYYPYAASIEPVIFNDSEVFYDGVAWKLSGDTPDVFQNGPLTEALVYGLHLGLTNGASLSVGGMQPIGILNCSEDGSVESLRIFDSGILNAAEGNQAIRLAMMDKNGIPLYELYNPAGVGLFTYNELGELIFHPFIQPLNSREATEPEATEEATEAPTEETAPPETEPAEPEDYDIYRLELKNSDDEMLYGLRSEEPVGSIHYDKKGYLVFEELSELPETYTEEGSAEDLDFDRAYFWGEDKGEGNYSFYKELDNGWVSVREGIITYRSDDVVKKPVETQPTEPPTEATEATTEPEVTEETLPAAELLPTVPEEIIINGKSINEYQSYYQNFTRTERGTAHPYRALLVNLPMPNFIVEMYLDDDFLQLEELPYLSILEMVQGYLLPILLASIAVLILTFVYLCCAAGHGNYDVLRAGGMNRIPLDLYFLMDCILGGLAFGGFFLCVDELRHVPTLVVGSGLAVGYLCCLLLCSYCFAFVAQIKTEGGFWWRNLLCIRILLLCKSLGLKCWNFLFRKAVPSTLQFVKKTWKKMLFSLEIATKRLIILLPLTWQWMLVSGIVLLLTLFLAIGLAAGNGFVVVFFGALILIIFYLAARGFAVLRDGAKRMSEGELNSKVNERYLLGCFKDFAQDLNKLASVAIVAAQKQLRSERMKTDLITNVSHDIKTPLTSIINYVDLLQKPHTEEEGQEYLTVLDRQSQRLKKLIEDLMDMSKASTGNMSVEITTVDAVESVNQALGEFADKLAKAQLSPLFRHTESSLLVRADGKLLWRVLSNLLGNAVKYALPGTRVYIDLMAVEGKVMLSVKNISREQLNIDAEELMERFVRGDDSRNTEGSGLGLNIAKSLMELQHGEMELLVDGDLFKVTLIFPEEPLF